jgi:hypothetical protein
VYQVFNTWQELTQQISAAAYLIGILLFVWQESSANTSNKDDDCVRHHNVLLSTMFYLLLGMQVVQHLIAELGLLERLE